MSILQKCVFFIVFQKNISQVLYSINFIFLYFCFQKNFIKKIINKFLIINIIKYNKIKQNKMNKTINKLLKASDIKDTEEDNSNFKIIEGGIDAFGRKVYSVQKGEDLEQQDQEQQDDSQEDVEQDEQENQVQYLKRRNVNLNIDNVVGKRKQVSVDADLRNTGVYECKLCDCVLKDSMSWLDHLNGKKHNQMLGMSMKVEKVGIETVKNKFQSLKKKEMKPINDFGDFDENYEERQRQKSLQNKKKKQQKLEKKQLERELKLKAEEEAKAEAAEGLDDDEMQMMLALGLPVAPK